MDKFKTLTRFDLNKIEKIIIYRSTQKVLQVTGVVLPVIPEVPGGYYFNLKIFQIYSTLLWTLEIWKEFQVVKTIPYHENNQEVRMDQEQKEDCVPLPRKQSHWSQRDYDKFLRFWISKQSMTTWNSELQIRGELWLWISTRSDPINPEFESTQNDPTRNFWFLRNNPIKISQSITANSGFQSDLSAPLLQIWMKTEGWLRARASRARTGRVKRKKLQMRERAVCCARESRIFFLNWREDCACERFLRESHASRANCTSKRCARSRKKILHDHLSEWNQIFIIFAASEPFRIANNAVRPKINCLILQ